MKKQIVILLLLASITMDAQHTGSLVVQKDQSTGITKIHLDSRPSFPAWPWPDSGAVRVRAYCHGTNFETRRMAWNDTLYYRFDGKIRLTAAIEWYRYGQYKGQTQFPVSEIPGWNNGDCFEFIKIATFVAPTVPIVGNPPAIVPGIWMNNWLVESNYPGTLLVFDSGLFGAYYVRTYDAAFSYQLESGTWWVQCIWPDGSFTPMTEYIVP